jgi:5,10-methylenetetrahydrofolate reductase
MKIYDATLPSLICEALPPLPDTCLKPHPELLDFAALSIPEQPMGIARCSALVYAQILRQEGYDKALLLHLRAGEHGHESLERQVRNARELDVRHFLVVQGDGLQGKGLTSAQALAQISSLDLPDISLGAAFDPHATDAHQEESRLRAKLDAGARFIITQPVLTQPQALACLQRLESIDPQMSVWLGLIDRAPRRPKLLERLGLNTDAAEDPASLVHRLKQRCAGFYWIS